MILAETESEPERAEPGPPAGVLLEIVDPARRLAPAAMAWLRAHAELSLRHLGVRGEVRARVVGDAEMCAAHERFSGVPGTTDVLTFDYAENPALQGLMDADILICADVAERESAARGHPVERELLLYLVHGVLHCMGHDDRDEAAAARMHAAEDAVLAAIGVGPVYGGRGPDGRGAGS